MTVPFRFLKVNGTTEDTEVTERNQGSREAKCKTSSKLFTPGSLLFSVLSVFSVVKLIS
jgi:hypothetical protein